MPKIAIVSLLFVGLVPALLGTFAVAAPHDGAAGGQRHIDPRTKAWFERTLERLLDETSSVADAKPGVAPRR